ncbi:MAG: trigger factor [Lawsonibacter sp.]
MKVTSVEKKEKSTVELTIQIEAEEFEAAVQKAYLKNRGSIGVPGFRKGKAPRKIIEGMYGNGVFYEDAINAVYPGAYEQAVQEQKLDDVGYPKMEVVEVGKEGFTFKALVSVRPEVKLGDYKGITAPKAESKVTEQDIDDEMKPYIDRATRLVSVERAAANGDTAVIDFEGFDSGVAFEGGKGENYELKIGSGSFVPGFEDQVIGMKADEEKDINITFPEDYHADLAGKPVVFHVKVKEIKEPQAPEVDDEFAKDVSEFETLEAFRKDLEQKVADRRAKQAQSDFENAVMEQLVENMECEIPDGMVEVQLDKLMDDYAMRLQGQGISMDDYMKMMGMTPDVMRASAKPSALRQVQMQLALTAVAEAEKLEITDEEYEAEVNRLAEQYNLEPEKVKSIVSAEDLKKDLKLKKASDLVVAEAKVGEAKEKTAEEAEKTEAAEEEKPKRVRKKKAEEPKAE